MLRRYTAMGLQSHHLVGPTTLIGSSNLADLIVKGPGVADRHALIEYHPVTRSYWLRDLGTLGGTYCNDQLLYGIIELKSADVLKFGKSAEYVFELPVLQPSPTMKRSTSLRHAGCTNGVPASSVDVSLPIIGTKLPAHPHREQFTRMPISTKRLCQHPRSSLTNPEDSDSSRTLSTTNTAPVNGAISPSSVKPSPSQRSRRSHSVGRENTFGSSSAKSSPGAAVNLPVLKSANRISGSSGYSSVEAKGDTRNGKTKTAVGNQLLQRVVRLQHEVQRRDEEIARLRENAMLPSVSGERVKGTLDEYRLALAEAKAENDKLRMIMALGESSDAAEKELSQEHLSIILFKTFFRVIVDELERLNQTLVKAQNRKPKLLAHWFSDSPSRATDPDNSSPDFRMSQTSARDYSDICSEVVKIVQDPFSFRLMDITARCHRSFQREKLPKQGKVMLGEMYDSFLKETIHPLSKAIDNFLPVIKEAATMGRESARACILFSQWSREFGDQIRKDGLSKKIMVYKVDELQSRFRDSGIPRHWLPPSVSPLLHALIDNATFEKGEANGKVDDNVKQEQTAPQGDVVPASQLLEEVSKFEAEIRKLKSTVNQSNEMIEQLRSEKEDLIGQLSAVEKARYNMDGSALRARRAARNSQSSTPVETPKNPPIPRIEVPRIELEQFGNDESEVFAGPEIVEPLNAEKVVPHDSEDVIVNGEEPHEEVSDQLPDSESHHESEPEAGDEGSLAEFEEHEQRQRLLSQVAEDEDEHLHHHDHDGDADDETSPKLSPEVVDEHGHEDGEVEEEHESARDSEAEPGTVRSEEPATPEIHESVDHEIESEPISPDGPESEHHSENEVIEDASGEDVIEKTEHHDTAATPHSSSVNSNRESEHSDVNNNDNGSVKEGGDEPDEHEGSLIGEAVEKLEHEDPTTPQETPRTNASNTPTHDANDEVDNSEVAVDLDEQHDIESVIHHDEEHMEDVEEGVSEPPTPREVEPEGSEGSVDHEREPENHESNEGSAPEDHPQPSEPHSTITTARSLAEATQIPRSEPVEFWHLALTLARMLKVVVPTSADSPDEDHTHRRVALELIVSEMQSILHAINNDSHHS
uniref:FHA domain-containing protein n=1 Tax=Panagrellus redivivus TaxID=6233 RepID=A0A7E4VQB9_PANRE